MEKMVLNHLLIMFLIKIKKIQNKINENNLAHNCSNPLYCGTCQQSRTLNHELKELINLKNIFQEFTKTRKYYYVNYEGWKGFYVL